MVNKLRDLVDKARKVQMTDQQKEQQRRSFAYGNAAFENERVTREMVDEEAEALEKGEKA